MNKNSFIRLKASFLVLVFSLNTVVGFACAMGVDMGFNNKHHHHDEASKHHHNSNEDSEKGGCCNDSVIKFQNLDKSLTPSGNIAINTPVFVAILSIFFNIDIFKQPQAFNQEYIFYFSHSPPLDIRKLIQSFQI